jgi:hypothetical protein
MKKLIALATFLFAFTINANAQDSKKMSSDEAAKNDVAAFIQKVTINESFKNDLYTLMVMKHDALSNPKLTASERESISKKFENKVLAGLDEAQQKQLKSNPELLKQVSH